METNQLCITMHPDEDFWMTHIGHLNDLYPDTESVQLAVTSAVEPYILQENVRMLFAFRHLRELSLQLMSSTYTIDQRLLTALAELIPLTKLELLCGTIPYDLEFTPLTSLRALKHLTILPFDEYGMVDDDVEVLSRFPALEELTIRPSSFGFTDHSLAALATLSALHTLSLCPMSSSITSSGLLALRALPRLHKLVVGLTRASQTLYLTTLDFVPDLCIKTRGPDMDSVNLLSVCNWCLPHNLVSLTLTPNSSIPAHDVLLSLSPLLRLSSLKLAFPHTEGQPARSPVADLSALSPLTSLRALQVLSARSSPVKVTVKSLSLGALSWPALTSLTLSCMASAYLLPEALDLLDNFSCLKQLCLCAEAGTPDAASSLRHPLNLLYLPTTLTHLSAELAQLTCSRELAPGGGGGGGGPPAALLPALQGLEMVDCCMADQVVGEVLPQLQGLRYLDLAEVDGLTDANMQALRTLHRLTHLSLRSTTSTALTAAPVMTLTSIASLKHLEWCTADTYEALDIGRLAPSLCLMSSLRYLSLATRAAAVRERGEGWWAVLQAHLPYCSFSLDPALEVSNAWGDCTSLT